MSLWNMAAIDLAQSDSEQQLEAAADASLRAGTAKLPVELRQKLTALSPVSIQAEAGVLVKAFLCKGQQCSNAPDSAEGYSSD